MRETVGAYQEQGGFEPRFLSDVKQMPLAGTLDLPGKPRVIPCPGHTRGSCSFHVAERDALFSGDALVTVDVVTGKPGPQLMPSFDNQDDHEALRTLDVLAATEAQYVLPGHGHPWNGVTAAVEEASQGRGRRS